MFKFAINTLSNLIDVGVKGGIIKGPPKGGTKKITIECAVSWQIVSHSSFVSINKLRGFRDTIVEFAFTENPSILEDRTGKLVIRNAFGVEKTISILQPGGVFTYGYYIEPVTDYSSGVYFNADGSELNLGFKAYKETFLNGESTGEIVEIKDINFNTSAFVTKTQDYWDEGINYLSFITNNNTSEEIQSLGEITIIPVVDSEGDIEFINNYTFNLYQSAGTKVYENLQIKDFYYDVRDAAGGTLTPVINTSIDYKWNGIGETTTLTYGYLDLNADNIHAEIINGAEFATINTDTAIVTFAANTDLNQGRTATISLNVTMHGLSNSKQTIAEQLKDTISYYSPIEITSFTVNSTIPASGGSVSSGTVNYVQVVNYVSGNTSNITSGATVTYGNAVSANSLGTDLKDRSSVGTLSVTVSLNETSDTASATVYQDANTRYLNGIYIVPYQPDSSWIVTVSNGNWNTCPASGGYVKCYGYCVYKYSSGGEKDELYTVDAALSWSGSPGWITNHTNGGYHISSRGTSVESARSSTATWSYSGFTSPGKTLTQEANAVINSSYSSSTTWNTPNISIGSGIGPAGGSATVSHSQSGTTTYYYLYTSGSTSGPYYSYPSGSTSIAITSNGNSRFSLSGNTLSHSHMGTYEGTDTCTVTVTGSGGKTNSASVSATNTYSDSGGSVSYGNVSAGAITNATIPASGGSATAYAGNGSQSWSKTAVTRSYASGSSKTITAASSGTNAVAPSASSYTASANSKGTTESSTTTVGSQYVTWSANGKSTGGTMYVYQAANSVVSQSMDVYKTSAFLKVNANSRRIQIQSPSLSNFSGSVPFATRVHNVYSSGANAHIATYDDFGVNSNCSVRIDSALGVEYVDATVTPSADKLIISITPSGLGMFRSGTAEFTIKVCPISPELGTGAYTEFDFSTKI